MFILVCFENGRNRNFWAVIRIHQGQTDYLCLSPVEEVFWWLSALGFKWKENKNKNL